MKAGMKKTPLALAVAALFASPVALAQEIFETNVITLLNTADVRLEKDVHVTNDVSVVGASFVFGTIRVDAESMAIVDDKQIGIANTVVNSIVDNNAIVNAGALQDASGNIGVNVAAGDNNQQANDVALAAVDAAFVFADAQVYGFQFSSANSTSNFATTNNAILANDAMRNATGNIGVNIAAGAGNMQKNDLAASINTSGTMAKASSWAKQETFGNVTTNTGATLQVANTLNVTLGADLSGSALGFGFGSYAGISDQFGDQYLDTWSGPAHPGGDSTGHIDVDSVVQGAVDRPQPSSVFVATPVSTGGALSFNESGDLAFTEISSIGLTGVVSGQVTFLQTIFRPHANNAILSDNALDNAVGNIGVNIAAGTNNLQRNGLALATAVGGGGGGGGGGE